MLRDDSACSFRATIAAAMVTARGRVASAYPIATTTANQPTAQTPLADIASDVS